MRSSSVILILLLVLALSCLAWMYASHGWLDGESKLREELQEKEQAISSLRQQLAEKDGAIDSLNLKLKKSEAEVEELRRRLDNLEEELLKLQANCSAFELRLKLLRGCYASLNRSVEELHRVLLSYASIPYAFPRVLNGAALDAVEPTVRGVAGRMRDEWAAYQEIYRYIVENVAYAEDAEFPYISYRGFVELDGELYCASLSTSTVRDYAQAPTITLRVKRGDCEDQAILAYAMIKCYALRILGEDRAVYFALACPRAEGHAFVVVSAGGGRICIVDPAGKYFTGTPRDAAAELQRYRGSWLSSGFDPSEVRLYEVDVEAGGYTVAFEGPIEEAQLFLSRR